MDVYEAIDDIKKEMLDKMMADPDANTTSFASEVNRAFHDAQLSIIAEFLKQLARQGLLNVRQ